MVRIGDIVIRYDAVAIGADIGERYVSFSFWGDTLDDKPLCLMLHESDGSLHRIGIDDVTLVRKAEWLNPNKYHMFNDTVAQL